MNTPKQLKAQFPYMFAIKKGEIDPPRGWFSSFVQLCMDIDQLLGENKRGFHWEQVKAKLGGARYYWDMTNKQAQVGTDLFEKITALVDDACKSSMESCEVCGALATLDCKKIVTLCDAKHPDRKIAARFFTALEM